MTLNYNDRSKNAEHLTDGWRKRGVAPRKVQWEIERL